MNSRRFIAFQKPCPRELINTLWNTEKFNKSPFFSPLLNNRDFSSQFLPVISSITKVLCRNFSSSLGSPGTAGFSSSCWRRGWKLCAWFGWLCGNLGQSYHDSQECHYFSFPSKCCHGILTLPTLIWDTHVVFWWWRWQWRWRAPLQRCCKHGQLCNKPSCSSSLWFLSMFHSLQLLLCLKILLSGHYSST